MKYRPLILGSLAVTLAGTAAWGGYVRWGSPAKQAAPQVTSKVPTPVKRVKSSDSPSLVSAPAPKQSSAKPAREEVAEVKTPPPVTTPPQADFQPAPVLEPSQGPISEAELQRRAARVEQEANHDLKHLVGLLDLNETQQDRIFDALVRRAPDWHPTMLPVGLATPAPGDAKAPGTSTPTETAAGNSTATANPAPGPTLLDDIASELTPDQQQELANAELDRVEWWEAIIPQLLPDGETPVLDTSAGSGTAAAAAPPPPEEVKEGGEEAILD